jgi:hypothetical protein
MAFGASIALQVPVEVAADAETATTTLVDNRAAKAVTAVTARPIDTEERLPCAWKTSPWTEAERARCPLAACPRLLESSVTGCPPANQTA